MKRPKKTTYIVLIFIVIIAAIGLFFFFMYGPHRKVTPGLCKPQDINCMTEKKMSGVEVEYAQHQCSGPRGCRKPSEDEIKAATDAIRAFTKNSKLSIIPINGITPAGIMYYCSIDNHCWSINAQTNSDITSVAKLLETPTFTPQPIRQKP